MKRVFFLRHSIAENKRLEERDFDRKLTLEGEKLAEVMVERMFEIIKGIDLAVISPAVRTKETADIFMNKITVKSKRYEDRLYYGMGLNDFESLFFEIDDNVNSVLVVGHNPFITQMSMYFTDKYDLFLHPASFVYVKFDINEWIKLSNTRVADFQVFISM